MGEVIGDENVDTDMLRSISSMLAMPEEQFRLIAPGILESYKQSLNNANDKLILVQALNASGGKAEDLTEGFDSIVKEIDNLTTISRQKRDFIKEMIGTICNAIVETEGIAKRILSIPIEFCAEGVKAPQYAHISDSGRIYLLSKILLLPQERQNLFQLELKLLFRQGMNYKFARRVAGR